MYRNVSKVKIDGDVSKVKMYRDVSKVKMEGNVSKCFPRLVLWLLVIDLCSA